MFIESLKNKISEYLKKQKSKSGKTAIMIFIVLTIRWGLAEAYHIPSESMNPTLKSGDRIMVNKAQYAVRIPFTKISIFETGTVLRGDVVVFRYPKDESTFYVKRVIALPGETVFVDDQGHLFINGKMQNEPYISQEQNQVLPLRSFGPILVPDGQIFVLGDNRLNSSDSRVWGFLPKHNLLGKVAFKWFGWVD